MAEYILNNTSLTLTVSNAGAELTSIYDPVKGIQYLWNADPAYWKRHSPILFPFVGSMKNKSYTYQGQTYPMSQHGFARDMIFALIRHTEEEIWFSLDANEDTLKIYPFQFQLRLGYRLQGRIITVLWEVINKDKSEMNFSIGGHPAFYCPMSPSEKQENYYISFDTGNPLKYLLVDNNGLAVKEPHTLVTDEGTLRIGPDRFDQDALIIEDNQCHKVSLLTPARIPYLTVAFDAPLLGLWSPAKKNAPFVCIEPWYGRCDASDFTGTLEEREYGNRLQPGEAFKAKYSIEIHEM